MSLFGTPPESSRQSLFDDEDNAPGASPWQMPTPRKGRPADLVRALLADVDVPSGYRETFDAVHHNDAVGEKISLAGVTKVLSAARLSADAQTKIVGLLAGEQDNGRLGDLDRGAFHVLLALIGLAQEGEEIHLDAVDERRKSWSWYGCSRDDG